MGEKRQNNGWLWALATLLTALAAFLFFWPGEGERPRIVDADLERILPEECVSFVPELLAEGSLPDAADGAVHDRSMLSAKRLFDERELAWGNLHQALEIWRRVVLPSSGARPRPPLFYDALEEILLAEETLCERLRTHRAMAEMNHASGDTQEALTHVRIILESIPDPFDYRYQWAKELELEMRADPELEP